MQSARQKRKAINISYLELTLRIIVNYYLKTNNYPRYKVKKTILDMQNQNKSLNNLETNKIQMMITLLEKEIIMKVLKKYSTLFKPINTILMVKRMLKISKIILRSFKI